MISIFRPLALRQLKLTSSLSPTTEETEDDALPRYWPQIKSRRSRKLAIFGSPDSTTLFAPTPWKLSPIKRFWTANRLVLVVTDPPYNVPIAGHVGGKGAVQHREFVMASG